MGVTDEEKGMPRIELRAVRRHPHTVEILVARS
jgi:hypothetical protein